MEWLNSLKGFYHSRHKLRDLGEYLLKVGTAEIKLSYKKELKRAEDEFKEQEKKIEENKKKISGLEKQVAELSLEKSQLSNLVGQERKAMYEREEAICQIKKEKYGEVCKLMEVAGFDDYLLLDSNKKVLYAGSATKKLLEQEDIEQLNILSFFARDDGLPVNLDGEEVYEGIHLASLNKKPLVLTKLRLQDNFVSLYTLSEVTDFFVGEKRERKSELQRSMDILNEARIKKGLPPITLDSLKQ